MFTPHLPPRSQPQPRHLYDVAVVGAGLAGSELAWRLAHAGHDVLLITQALDTLGNLYQPTMAAAEFTPGSLFAQVRKAIQPEMGGWAFHRALKAEIEATAGIHLLQSCVKGLEEVSGEVHLDTWEGPRLRAKVLVLAAGAFLKGRLLIGDILEDAGRLSEVTYDFLAENLASHGIYLNYASASTTDEQGTPEYEVRFQVIDAGELEGFKVAKLEHTYALGRCAAGEHTYASVLTDAASLAATLCEVLR